MSGLVIKTCVYILINERIDGEWKEKRQSI